MRSQHIFRSRTKQHANQSVNGKKLYHQKWSFKITLFVSYTIFYLDSKSQDQVLPWLRPNITIFSWMSKNMWVINTPLFHSTSVCKRGQQTLIAVSISVHLCCSCELFQTKYVSKYVSLQSKYILSIRYPRSVNRC